MDLYPPELANKFLPAWYKKQKIYRKDEIPQGKDVKNCPAIQDTLTSGIIIPSWSDILIEKFAADGKWEWQATVGLSYAYRANEDWILQAMERLNEGGLTPDQRANLEIAIVQEASEIAAWKDQLRKVEEAEAKAKEAEAKAKEVDVKVKEVEAKSKEVEAKAQEAKIETAKKLKENGIDIQLIAESTGLSIEEVEQL